ncbi:MAG: efflux RND transporter permease subunit [Peptococcaceae bacterium]|nr:efflux RND transporter permease subunit [Peptococcaceae bacterium]
MKLADFSVDRPVTIVMVILGLLVLGLFSLHFLSVDLYPEITNPAITIAASYPGAGPQEVEHDVTKVIEAGVGTISNVQKITSTSQTGAAQIQLQFAWGTNMDTALADVRARLELVKRRLPDAVDNVNVYKFDTTMMPIMNVAAGGKHDLATLKKMVDDVIQPALERVDGVAAVTVRGGLNREVQVLVSPWKLQQYGLSINQVMQALQGENIDVAGGIIPKGHKNYAVRGLGKYENVEQIRNIPVQMPQGGFVHIGDLAEVRDTFARQDSYTLLNGQPAVSFSVQKQSGANTVDVADRVKKELDRLQKQLPGDIHFAVAFDQSDTIKTSINDVARTTVLGGGLAILILLVFLRNVRTTVVIAISIPFAIITTFTMMYFNKMTLNMMSMGGLSLGVGHMVDYSIVVLESIYRHRKNGEPPKDAAKKGTAEVGTAVIASALTVAVVFLPMIFVEGLAGQLFKQFALTVAFSQLAALFVSLTLIPLICSRLFSRLEDAGQGDKWWQRLFRKSEVWYGALDGKYRDVLAWSLKKRLLVVAVTAAVTFGSFFLIPLVGTEFFPAQDSGQFNVDVQMPNGTVLADTGAVMERLGNIVAQLPEVDTILTSVGGGRSWLGIVQTEVGQLSVRLKPKSERNRSTDQIVEELRGKMRGIPGASIRVSVSSGLGILSRAFSGRPIEIMIKGDDLDELKRLAKQVTDVVNGVEGTRQVQNSMEAGRPELRVLFDRERIAQNNLTAGQVAQVLKVAGDGQVVSSMDAEGTAVDVRLLLSPEVRTSTAALENLFVSQGGVQLSLTQLARLEEGEGPNAINRISMSRVAYVYGDYAGRDLGSIQRDIQAGLAQIPLPAGYIIQYGGQQQDMAESFKSLGLALFLALLLVYMVMAGQFESLLYPFCIMFSIPVSATGVVLSLLLTGRAFSLPAYIGIIMMSGIVVNNAIVLVDYINTLKKRGMERDEAIVAAGPVRLRPILMTALTTLFGLMPLALGLGEGAETQAPMATVVIGGLLVSTFLTLVIVPVVYTLFDDLGKKIVSKLRRRHEGVPQAAGK